MMFQADLTAHADACFVGWSKREDTHYTMREFVISSIIQQQINSTFHPEQNVTTHQKSWVFAKLSSHVLGYMVL